MGNLWPAKLLGLVVAPEISTGLLPTLLYPELEMFGEGVGWTVAPFSQSESRRVCFRIILLYEHTLNFEYVQLILKCIGRVVSLDVIKLRYY